MKLLVIQFDDAEDISVFVPETEVTVARDATLVLGKVMANIHMVEPPSLDGDFHITAIE